MIAGRKIVTLIDILKLYSISVKENKNKWERCKSKIQVAIALIIMHDNMAFVER